jgi:REP-associated tyrosine transposase
MFAVPQGRYHGRDQEIKDGNDEMDQEERTTNNDFQWQAGYGIFSVSPSNVERVKRYIANQEDRHKRISFQDEFREICKRQGIEIDERYVWD